MARSVAHSSKYLNKCFAVIAATQAGKIMLHVSCQLRIPAVLCECVPKSCLIKLILYWPTLFSQDGWILAYSLLRVYRPQPPWGPYKHTHQPS